MDIFDKLDIRYILETNKSKEDILLSLKFLSEGARKLKGLSSFFQYPDYSSMSIYDNKIVELYLTANQFSMAPIGDVSLYLESTETGTTITAELKADRSQLQIPFLGLLFSLVVFILLGKHIIKISDTNFIISAIALTVFVLAITIVAIIYVKTSMKNCLFKIFRDIGLGNQFNPI